MPLLSRVFQGIGSLPGSHKDFAFGSLLLFYYTQVLGVPATATSIALAIALVVDAITDPLVGVWSDNLRSRFGRRHPLMYAAAVPCGLFVYLLFMPPAGASEPVLIGWLVSFAVLTHLAFTLFGVPWAALAAEYSQDYVERSEIIVYRHLVGWIGGVVFAFTILTFVFPATETHPQGQLNPASYPPFALVTGALITLWCFATTALTQRDVPYLLQPDPESPRPSLGQTLGQIPIGLRSQNFRLVLVAFLIFSTAAGAGRVFDMFMNTYFWEFAAEEIRWFTFTILGAFVAFVLVPPLQQRFEKHRVLQVALIVFMAVSMMKVLLRLADIWPDNGETLLLIGLVFNDMLMVCALTVGGIMFASMIADLADEQQLGSGLRQEGLYSAGVSFANKAASSAGLIIGGGLLDYFVIFPREAAVGEVDPNVLVTLALTDGILVNLFVLISIVLLRWYTLDRRRLAEIQRQLSTGGIAY